MYAVIRLATFRYLMQKRAGKFKLVDSSAPIHMQTILPLVRRGNWFSPQSGFGHSHGVIIGIMGLKLWLSAIHCLCHLFAPNIFVISAVLS